jgi:N-acetylneuraminic acid mutarotase
LPLVQTEQFTATGYYSNGSSEVLTNGMTSGGGSWAEVAGMPAAKFEAGCAAANGQMYAVSGTTGDNLVFAYNPALNVWTIPPPLPSNYAFPGAAGIGNKLYVFGGCQGSDCRVNVSSELDIYDTVSNIWSSGAPMNLARTAMGVGVINGKIYAAGGQANNYTYQSELQIYDPASNTWMNGQALPVAYSSCGAAVINDKLYVVGGYNGSTTSGSLFVYDPTTDRWTTNAPMPTPREGLGAAAVNGLLYAIDGVTASSTPTNLVEVYNPAADSWSTGAPTLIAHYNIRPAVINGTIYLAGNGPNNTAITNVESYTPQTLLSWSSSSLAVASIDANGVATGLTNGVTTITATAGNVSGNTTLTVVTTPVISVQPTNNTVSPNGSVTFSVSASGGDLSYQWQFDGANITGATGASLTITNVSANDIGVYTAIVNNAAGSVTSSPVMLATTEIHMLASVYVNGPIGSNYLIQATSDLPGGWSTLTNIALPSQPYIYVDYGSVTNKQQFYRAVPQ